MNSKPVGGYISTRINKKLLHIRVEYFLELAILCEDEKAQKDIIKEIKNEIKKTNKKEELFEENNIGKSIFDIGVNVSSLLSNLTTLFSPENSLIKVIGSFFRVKSGSDNYL